jgi:uncharacterized protein with HEPN domain
MSRRDDTVPMRHMLDHGREVIAMVEGRTRRDLDTDRLFQLALTRLLEIIGEAVNRVTAAERELYADIPWLNIVGTRHRIVHGYDVVDYDIVWDIATIETPNLVASLDRIFPGHRS